MSICKLHVSNGIYLDGARERKLRFLQRRGSVQKVIEYGDPENRKLAMLDCEGIKRSNLDR